MSTKFSDEWGDFEIRVNDPRGQIWLYKEPSRALNIGWNHENPSRGHIYLSEISSPNSDAQMPSSELARSIARFFAFMVKPGGGYSSVRLHFDKEMLFHRDDLSIIDQYLSRYAMIRQLSNSSKEAVWVRTTEADQKTTSTLH